MDLEVERVLCVLWKEDTVRKLEYKLAAAAHRLETWPLARRWARGGDSGWMGGMDKRIASKSVDVMIWLIERH